MTTIGEAIDTIYDAKRGQFRDLEGETVTPDNLPRKGDVVACESEIQICEDDWPHQSWLGDQDWHILYRAEQPEPGSIPVEKLQTHFCIQCKTYDPDKELLGRVELDGPTLFGVYAICNDCLGSKQSKPDLIYFPWPSGIDGITGVIGPRGDIPKGTGFIAYGDNGTMVPNRYFLNGTKQVDGVSFRFPADAELTWIRSEDEVPQELLREAHNRDKLEDS